MKTRMSTVTLASATLLAAAFIINSNMSNDAHAQSSGRQAQPGARERTPIQGLSRQPSEGSAFAQSPLEAPSTVGARYVEPSPTEPIKPGEKIDNLFTRNRKQP